MSTEIARTQGNTLDGKMRYAQALATSNLLPRQYQQQPGNLLFALEYADALGVSPIHAITSIHVIEGKPSASADLIGSMVRKAGHRLRVTGDDTHAKAVLIRADDPDFEFVAEWNMDRARQAGLTGKGVWKNYPGAMLRSRAITEVARMGAPDALYGVQYTAEELGAEVNADGEPVDLGEHRAPAPAPGAAYTAPAAPAAQAPRRSSRDKLAAALPQATPPVDPVTGDDWTEIDWNAEIEQAGGDVDAIKAIWHRAKRLHADEWVIDLINEAGAAAHDALTPDGDVVDAEAVEA